MHILGILLGAIGVVILFLVRYNRAADAAQSIGEVVDDTRGAWRRWSWSRKSHVDQLREIDDPRLAATVMMVAVAEYDGALTDAEQRVMNEQITKTFGATAIQAEELIAHARWLNRNGGDIGSVFLKVMPAVRDKCDQQERTDLINMLTLVQNVSGSSDVPAGQIAKLEGQLRSPQ